MASRLRSSSSAGSAAQGVVAAELDEQVGRLVAEHPVEPRQPARRGVAGDPGIEHLAVIARGLERRLQLGRESRPRDRTPVGRRSANRRARRAGRRPRPRRPAPPCRARSSAPSLRTPARRTISLHARVLGRPTRSARAPGRSAMIELADVHRDPAQRRGSGHDPARHRPRGRGRQLGQRGGPLGLRQVQPDADRRRHRAADRRPVRVDGVDLGALDEDRLAVFRRDRRSASCSSRSI